MTSTIRVRAILNDDITEVQVLIQHPMDTGLVKNANGEIIPAHFIQQLSFQHNGRTVFLADWGPAVSRDPYVRFRFKGANKGDELNISWVDNTGATDTMMAKIQ